MITAYLQVRVQETESEYTMGCTEFTATSGGKQLNSIQR